MGMQPTRDTQATLVDLLERILDKGLILNADVIINVAGIPLLGVNLKAALAGMETMLKYGIWQDWDEAQRAFAAQEMRMKGGKALPFSVQVGRRGSDTSCGRRCGEGSDNGPVR